jgi:hypothetical protein
MSADGGSCDHTSNGNHGKASILKFVQLVLLLLCWVGGEESHGVETEVARGTVVVVHVGKSGESACLKERDPSEDLDHGFWKGIVGIDDLREGLKRELFSRDTEEFGNKESNSGQHSSTSVLQFGLTEPWDPLWGTLSEPTTKSLEIKKGTTSKTTPTDTYLSETTRIPVDRGALRAEWDWLRTFSTDISVGECVQRSGGLHRARGGEGTSRASKSRNSQQKLGHGQQLSNEDMANSSCCRHPTAQILQILLRYVSIVRTRPNPKGYVFNYKMSQPP